MWSSGRLTSLWNDREVSSSTCAQCGRPLDAHDRHVRFRLPDVVVSAGIELHDESVWMTDPDPDRAVMLRVEGVGRFVRVLLPVQLHDGFSVTFGTWVDVAGDAQFRDIIDVWWSDRYGSYSFTGSLANDLPLWGLPMCCLRARGRARRRTRLTDAGQPAPEVMPAGRTLCRARRRGRLLISSTP